MPELLWRSPGSRACAPPMLSWSRGLVLCRPDKASATLCAPHPSLKRFVPLSPTLARKGADAFTRNLSLERKLANALEGEARFDAFTRGRYATDASIYQIMPLGVVFPKGVEDLEATLKIAREEGVSVIPRGAGTSQNGQPIGEGLVVDFSRHLNEVRAYDPAERTVTVAPGIVLERLNAKLRVDGLFFPDEDSTAIRCTIG